MPCVLASLKEVLVPPLPPAELLGECVQGAGRGFGWNSGSRAPEDQAGSDSALGPGTQPRTGLSREASGENSVGALNKTLWVPGLSFPALKSRTGPMSLPWYLGSP